ncbi:acyl-CoA transferase [Mycolicibacterium mucogenicum]|uniref:Acyl-CoA transferase n=1 Tax=Mycolicibacterium mucogenicum TaxID=56689 RepID=A0A1A3GFJ0_MYCMU|nr:CoA transferase [Mycolicibacterium mucogenicum]OBJ34807.1 acyl-CoA transferase [Mycolicibacterium mucogenicum]
MSDEVARDWSVSGLAALTGMPDGPPDISRAAVLTRARAVASELSGQLGIEVDAAELLAGRAALAGLHRQGRTSAGGATRLIAGRDGWFALTLARPDDVAAVPALLESDVPVDHLWPAITEWAGRRQVAAAAERARLLGLPVGVLGETAGAAPVVRRHGNRKPFRDYAGLLVVDLSSMWAGPLCGQLLARAGATVIKVESPLRPDGTRQGERRFFDWMNAGKLCYAADFGQPDELRQLLSVADVVIESSRPDALVNRGLGPDDVPARDGRVWLRVTGHGTAGAHAYWVGFGDDAAVSGGLVGSDPAGSGPVFCGDAIADPLTGMHAALAVAASLHRGGGEVVEIALAAVAAQYAALPLTAGDSDGPVAEPVAPALSSRAGELGADNARVRDIVRERASGTC